MEDEEESETTFSDNLTSVLVVSLLASYLGHFQYGYATWVVHNPAAMLVSNMTKVEVKNLKFFWFVFSPAVIFFPAGGVTGVVLFANLVDKYGRKQLLLWNNTFALFASAFLCISSILNVFNFTIFANFTTGMCSGVFSCCGPMYILEMSPTPMRGSLTATSAVFFSLGILIAQLLGLPHIFGNKEGFPLLAAVLGIVATVCILLLLICPESPRFIFIQMKDEIRAREVLQSLRAQEDIEDEIQELHEEDLYECMANEKEMTMRKFLHIKKYRWPIITIIVLMAGSQFSGINGMFFYSKRVYRAMGLSENIGYILSLGISSVLTLASFCAVKFIETWGRRIPLIMGFMVCSMTCILLTFTLEFQVYSTLMAYVSLVFIIIFLLGHMIGPAPIRLVIVGELFLQSTRASAYAIGGCAVWFSRVISGLILIQLESLLGPYSLLFYWPPCVATFIYLFRTIPETKEKSFLGIQEQMAQQLSKEKRKKRMEIKGNR